MSSPVSHDTTLTFRFFELRFFPIFFEGRKIKNVYPNLGRPYLNKYFSVFKNSFANRLRIASCVRIKISKFCIFSSKMRGLFFSKLFNFFKKKVPKNFRPAARSTQIRGSTLPLARRHYAKWSRLTVNSRFLKFQLQPRNIFSTQVGLKVEAKSAFF